jgi:hypothetical protein
MRQTTARFIRRAVLALCVLMLHRPVDAQPAEAARGIDAATGAALQGDAARARAVLLATPSDALGSDDRRMRECVIERFASPVPPALPESAPRGLARGALQAYRSYWQEALLNPEKGSAAEEKLRRNLGQLLRQPDGTPLDTLSADLEARLKKEGWWSLQGRTGRLREFMLWRSQEARVYQVMLPEGPFATDVLLLGDFASLGWGDYATCGRRGAGGWATRDRLFAVVPRYPSLDSEEFRVTFLGHETQHFADLRRWPKLAPWHLEYRAKLVELAQVNQTRDRVLRKFLEDRKDDPASPHSYANRRVVQDLTSRLGLRSDTELFRVPIAELNSAALALLASDTRSLGKP